MLRLKFQLLKPSQVYFRKFCACAQRGFKKRILLISSRGNEIWIMSWLWLIGNAYCVHCMLGAIGKAAVIRAFLRKGCKRSRSHLYLSRKFPHILLIETSFVDGEVGDFSCWVNNWHLSSSLWQWLVLSVFTQGWACIRADYHLGVGRHLIDGRGTFPTRPDILPAVMQLFKRLWAGMQTWNYLPLI